MVFLKYTKEKTQKRRVVFMLNDEICKLREELNNSIINGQDYEITYKLSVELDQLIAEYYRIELDLSKKKKKVKDGVVKHKRKNTANV